MVDSPEFPQISPAGVWRSPELRWGYGGGFGHDLCAKVRSALNTKQKRLDFCKTMTKGKGKVFLEDQKIVLALVYF